MNTFGINHTSTFSVNHFPSLFLSSQTPIIYSAFYNNKQKQKLMGCFSFGTSKKHSSYEASLTPQQQNPETRNLEQEILLRIPGCTVHLMEEGESLELTNGAEFTLLKISDDDVFLATVIKIGDDLQWPLTKDEPVVKLDSLHYLFSLPINDGDPLSYGVSFMEEYGGYLGLLDSFLKEHSCFSSSLTSMGNQNYNDVNWKEFAPRIEDYNNVLAKAIAGGTGQVVKGIFNCSNAYTNQVQKGGETILTAEKDGFTAARESRSNRSAGATKKSGINKSLKRVRKMSKMTEKLSKSMLNGVGLVTGSVMTPIVRSQAGKGLLGSVPGEVLLASLDVVNRVFDAAEVAEKKAFSASSKAATRVVSRRFGESAGEATEDVLATAGHCFGTAWNIFKVRKAINPASAVSSGVLNGAAKNRKRRY